MLYTSCVACCCTLRLTLCMARTRGTSRWEKLRPLGAAIHHGMLERSHLCATSACSIYIYTSRDPVRVFVRVRVCACCHVRTSLFALLPRNDADRSAQVKFLKEDTRTQHAYSQAAALLYIHYTERDVYIYIYIYFCSSDVRPCNETNTNIEIDQPCKPSRRRPDPKPKPPSHTTPYRGLSGLMVSVSNQDARRVDASRGQFPNKPSQATQPPIDD